MIGLVSWSKGCGRRFRPSVWTRVETHVTWILETIEGEERIHEGEERDEVHF